MITLYSPDGLHVLYCDGHYDVVYTTCYVLHHYLYYLLCVAPSSVLLVVCCADHCDVGGSCDAGHLIRGEVSDDFMFSEAVSGDSKLTGDTRGWLHL